jgi:hypothetical protein
MSLNDSDEIKLAKYYISTNLYQFTVFYNKNFDILFNFESPMAVASEDLKINASQFLQSDQIQYENVRMIQDPSGAYIGVYEGNRIRIVLMLKQQVMNPIVEENIRTVVKQFADAFEAKYRKELKDYEKYTGTFDVTDILSQNLFLDMSLPHIARYKGFRPEDRLEEYIFDAADKFCKVVGYFYIDNLIYLTKQHVIDEARNIVLTDPKRAKKEGIDPDHIQFPPDEAFLVAIFNLRKLGMLEPIKVESLNSFSKIQY